MPFFPNGNILTFLFTMPSHFSRRNYKQGLTITAAKLKKLRVVVTVSQVDAELPVRVENGGCGSLVGGRTVALDGGLQISGQATRDDLNKELVGNSNVEVLM